MSAWTRHDDAKPTPAATAIRFNNLLTEAGHAFRAGDLRKSEELLAEARTIVAFERRLLDEAVS